jgi:acyl dehydratase
MVNPVEKTFVEWQVGDIASFEEVISEKLVDDFAKLSGDANPLHTDADYSKETEFKKPIGHGMIAGMFFSKLIGMYLPGKYSLYLKQSLQFKQPIFAGTQVKIVGKILNKTESFSVLNIETKVVDKNNDNVYVEGEAMVKVLR